MDLNQVPDGWWIYVTPLAKLNPEEWILGVLRKGKNLGLLNLHVVVLVIPKKHLILELIL